MRLAPAVAVVGTAAAILILAAPAAYANGGVAMELDVRNPQIISRSVIGGSCTWEISSDVVAVNITNHSETVNSIGARVSWSDSQSSGLQSSVTIENDAGLAGATIDAGSRRDFGPFITRFEIPCSATFGDLAVFVTTPDGTGSGDSVFLQDGTPVPMTGVGSLGLAALLGVAVLRRNHRATRSWARTEAAAGGCSNSQPVGTPT